MHILSKKLGNSDRYFYIQPLNRACDPPPPIRAWDQWRIQDFGKEWTRGWEWGGGWGRHEWFLFILFLSFAYFADERGRVPPTPHLRLI